MNHPPVSVDNRLLIAAVEASSDGIVISDAQQPDMPVIYVNPAFTRITGYAYEETVGKNCRFLQGPDTEQAEIKKLRQCLAEGRACRLTLRNFRKDGSVFWNELRIAPIAEGERVRFFVGVQTEVTERITAQERAAELQRNLEQQNILLANLNKTKNEFLGMAAHDLRNPLANIVLATSLLLEKTGRESAETRARLESIRESADFMRSLIDGLLDVTTIEAGKLDLRLSKCSLVGLTAQTVALHRSRAEEKGIELSFNMAVDHPVMAIMDPNKVRQVLDNMVSNALKYSPPGSRTTVTVGEEASDIWVAVTDTGPGIPAEEVDRIFKPFGRARVAPTGGERSTGLGLTISRKIAEAHRGRIELETAEGRGSTFRMVLPKRRQEDEAMAE